MKFPYNSGEWIQRIIIYIVLIYILDASASISDLNRWTLIRSIETSDYPESPLTNEYTSQNFLFNIDLTTSPIGFSVYSITSK